MNINGKNISSVYLGNKEVIGIYKGNELIYSSPQVLPYDAEVTYIEGTGTQYIDTGIICNNDCKFIINAKITNLKNCAIFGSRNYVSTWSKAFCLYLNTSAKAVFGFGWVDVTKSIDTSVAHIYTLDRNDYYIDNVPNGQMVDSDFTCSTTALLFTSHTGSGGATVDSSYFEGYVYSCQIYKDDMLVWDGIPVRKNGVGMMYDKISGQLFGDENGAGFAYGADVNPPYDAEVEYLLSDGASYIATGVLTADQTSISLDAQLTSYNVQNRIIGTNNGRLEMYINGGSRWSVYANSTAYSSGTSANTNRNVFSISNVTNKASVGTKTWSFTHNATSWQGSEISIFSRANDGTLCPNGYIYSAQIYEAGVLVRDYIPVRVGTTGYLYDKVSDTLFGNAGSGAFTIGADV